MEYTEKFGFAMPSRDADDIADINKISANFMLLDQGFDGFTRDYVSKHLIDQDYTPTSENAQSGRAVAQAIATVETGGASSKWQHLTTIEFEAEAQQYLSDKYTESDGVKGVFVKVFIPISSAAVSFMIRLLDAADNEVVRIQPQGYVSTTDNTYGQAKLELVNGLWDGWWTASVKADNNAWTSKYGLKYADAGKTEADLPFVSRIIIGTSNNKTLPVGTRMEVWVLK